MNQKLNRGEVVSKKRKHCNQNEAPTKTKGAELKQQKQVTLSSPYGTAINESHTVCPKATRNYFSCYLVPKTAERFTNENFYETKTTTALIIRTEMFLLCLAYNGQGLLQGWN
ncbi:MAG: hypothetical protein IPN43_13830 [Chitinophagaceae bacterium]|nr:hypothetical protein [Chitinophagaceae bacterium]